MTEVFIPGSTSSLPKTTSLTKSTSLTKNTSEPAPPPDPVLCQHCGRTASNDISCQGSCVADSGY